jgi:Phospholipase_D-nuclease N-terminal/Short C-terminal domain
MDHNFWDVFFLLLIYIPLLLIWAFSIFDIFRRDDLGGLAKGIWLVVVILIPLFGTFIYLIFRRPGATEEERQAIDQANRQLAQQYATPSSADQLRTLAELHDSGKLTDDEFAKEKARVIQGSPA